MHRASPIVNKYLHKKWVQEEKQKHARKLRTSKASVDNKPPGSFSHLNSNPKKIQLLEDKYTEIERENRILYEKMLKINKKVQGRTSNSNRRSLNSPIRRMQTEEIEKQNQKILQRIMRSKSVYSTRKFESERKTTEKRLQVMCEYPYILGTKNKPSRNYTPVKSRKRSSRMLRKSEPDQLVTVYKKGKSIEDKFFIIEMKTDGVSFLISAYDLESPLKFCLVITYKEAKLYFGPNREYVNIANSIQTQDNQLVLLDLKQRAQKQFAILSMK